MKTTGTEKRSFTETCTTQQLQDPQRRNRWRGSVVLMEGFFTNAVSQIMTTMGSKWLSVCVCVCHRREKKNPMTGLMCGQRGLIIHKDNFLSTADKDMVDTPTVHSCPPQRLPVCLYSLPLSLSLTYTHTHTNKSFPHLHFTVYGHIWKQRRCTER